MVRAKFQCQRIEKSKYAGGENSKIILTAVTAYNAPEDKPFWDATPAGTIELQVVNDKAVEYFEPGKQYFIDFTQA
jgi:hypothetical protein